MNNNQSNIRMMKSSRVVGRRLTAIKTNKTINPNYLPKRQMIEQ